MSGNRSHRITALLCGIALAVLGVTPVAAWSEEPGQDEPVLRYVALGDSYASGESVPPYDPATNVPGNRCHRSERAYPNLLPAAFPGLVDLVAFRACSGATTAEVVTAAQYPTQPPQLAGLPEDVEVVSITVGGNDIGFADIARACLLSPDCGGPDRVGAAVTALRNLPTALATTYAAVRASTGPHAAVFVLGYPQLFEVVSQGPGCGYLTGQERLIVRSITTALNATIRAAARDAGFVFVDPTRTGSPFLGHELCTATSFFTNIFSLAPFHPTAAGQRAYALLLTAALHAEVLG